ncbi:hypothetical protein [Arthrobacter sp. CJ23]|uniref:hypothetical protein n=1 Tax=Arthrobacter sp. CJ23 TaxID=2972479 RepID=UPI00215C426E|nr:hypothetical protein [Arthrobacter sp. CJ23]UVJ37754.1 hypothetical protein NVV90_10680 [Arthrobacter sp. CJ23]
MGARTQAVGGRRRRAAAVGHCIAVMMLAAVLPTSCASDGTGTPSPDTTPAVPGLTGQINQSRDNYATHVIELQLSNTGMRPVTVVSAVLDSPAFNGPAVWSSSTDGTEIPPGLAKSLPAQLPAAVCSASEPKPQPAAQMTVQLRGTPDLIQLPVTDPFGVLDRNHAELCLDRNMADVVRLSWLPVLHADAAAGTAVLQLSLEPVGGPGSVTIESIGETTLLAADPARQWPRNVTVRGIDPPSRLELHIRPARCDPHAVAEDKVGTLIPFHVSLNGSGSRSSGTVKVAAPAALRGDILDFVTAACSGR